MSIHTLLNFNIFQLVYTKQRAQTVADYRGFQTMDAREHPEVTRGIKAKQLTDDVSIVFEYLNQLFFCLIIRKSLEASKLNKFLVTYIELLSRV